MISSLRDALRRILRRCPFLVLPFIFLLNRAAGVNERMLVVRSFSLNKYDRKLDWQACGIRVASDNCCYFACSSHAYDRGCAFFRYDPRMHELDLLCEDITTVCGEDPHRTPPQGKIRSDIVEANGWLYFGTHLANYWPEAEASYTGGHVVGYHLATGEFHDYGVVRPNLTILSGVAVDPARSLLYVYVTPYPHGDSTHLYRIDLRSRTKQDLGVVHPGEGISHFLFVDRGGDCWFASTGAGGTLFRANVSNGKLDRWEDLLPKAYSWETISDKLTDHKRCIRWLQPLPGADAHRCLLTMQTSNGDSGDMLWLLDTSKETTQAFRPLGRVGPTGLGLAVSENNVHFVQQSYAKPFDRVANKVIQRTFAKIVAKLMFLGLYPGLHLRTMNLDTRSMEDQGLIVDQDGRKPVRIESVAADRGVVFMTGDWRLLPGEKGSLLFHHRTKSYESLATGEFFAIAYLG